MRSKFSRVLTIALIVGAAMAALGAGAALWSSNIIVNGSVNTGKVSAQFTQAFTDDDDFVNDPTRDSQDTGQCPDEGGVALPGRTTTSCDPAASGADPKPHITIDVARCDASITSPTGGRIVKTNAYPGYFCTAWFQVQNNGTIPILVTDVQLCDANGCHSVPPGQIVQLDLNGDGAPDVAVDITELRPCQYLGRGQTLFFDVDQQVLSGVPQGKSLAEKVQVTVAAWNNPGPNCLSPTPAPTTTALSPTPCQPGPNCPTPTPTGTPCPAATCETPTPTATPCDPATGLDCPTPTPCTGANCPTATPCTGANCPTPTPCALAPCTPTPTPCPPAVCAPTPTPCTAAVCDTPTPPPCAAVPCTPTPTPVETVVPTTTP